MNDVIDTTNDTLELDEKKLRRMLEKIYRLERENSKTEKRSREKIIEEIQKIIEEEADKCY